MAHSIDFQKKNYPLAVYNFRVQVDQTTMSFTEVSGLAVEYEQVTYRHGLTFLEGEQIQSFPFDKFTRITCKRGAVMGKDPLFLYSWLKKRDLRSMQVDLCDEMGAAVLAWKIAAAVAVSVKAPAFSASTNEAVVDTVELQVRGISVVKI